MSTRPAGRPDDPPGAPHVAPASAPAGFTAVYCQRSDCPAHTCGDPAGDQVVAALRATVRRCPHGVLVATGCLHTSLRPEAPESVDDCPRCALGDTGTGHGAGSLVIVQPCRRDRTPHGPLLVAGPLHEPADLTEFCAWLSDGLPRSAALPRHLHATVP